MRRGPQKVFLEAFRDFSELPAVVSLPESPLWREFIKPTLSDMIDKSGNDLVDALKEMFAAQLSKPEFANVEAHNMELTAMNDAQLAFFLHIEGGALRDHLYRAEVVPEVGPRFRGQHVFTAAFLARPLDGYCHSCGEGRETFENLSRC